jgi:hypothetical protein
MSCTCVNRCLFRVYIILQSSRNCIWACSPRFLCRLTALIILLNGYSKIINAVKRQRNLGLMGLVVLVKIMSIFSSLIFYCKIPLHFCVLDLPPIMCQSLSKFSQILLVISQGLVTIFFSLVL